MAWLENYSDHECDFPTDTPREERKEYWQCPECLTVYRVSVSQWTGWWSPDTSDSVTGETIGGVATVYCMYETWNTCPPSVNFEPIRWGIYGDQNCSGWGMHDNDPEDKPDWIIEQEAASPRPLWVGKEIPGGTRDGIDKSTLSRVPYPSDDDLPPKKRSWFTKG